MTDERLLRDVGPFDTDRQARDASATVVRARLTPGPGVMWDGNRAVLEEAAAWAGVDLGAFDRRALDWLAGWEPEMCNAVAAGLWRAWQSGHHAGYTRGLGNAHLGP